MSDKFPDLTSVEEDIYEPFPSFDVFASKPSDLSNVDEFVAVLESAKAHSDPDRLKRAVDTATKWAAVDTGAIEGLYDIDRGFTFSVAAEAAAWDNMHLSVGDDAARAIQDALNGYEYVLDIVTETRPITEAWVKELHQIICASQDFYSVLTAAGPQQHPLPKGEYKKHRNNPFNIQSQRLHAYAPVSDTPSEMHRLIEELQSETFLNAHPVVQAAYAHYAFVCIHPFADGNGRVSRALASVFLYRRPGVPLVIFADQKPPYIDALEAADAGRFEPFVRFVGERAIDVVRMVAADMRRKPRPDTKERLRQLGDALLGRSGLPHEEVDALAGLLFDTWQACINDAIAEAPISPPLSLSSVVNQMDVVSRPPAGYRSPPARRTLSLIGISSGYASANIAYKYGPFVAKGKSEMTDFLLADTAGRVIDEALIRDLNPTVSPSLVYRLKAAAEEEVLNLIDELATAAEAALKKAGYRD